MILINILWWGGQKAPERYRATLNLFTVIHPQHHTSSTVFLPPINQQAIKWKTPHLLKWPGEETEREERQRCKQQSEFGTIAWHWYRLQSSENGLGTEVPL